MLGQDQRGQKRQRTNTPLEKGVDEGESPQMSQLGGSGPPAHLGNNPAGEGNMDVGGQQDGNAPPPRAYSVAQVVAIVQRTIEHASKAKDFRSANEMKTYADMISGFTEQDEDNPAVQQLLSTTFKRAQTIFIAAKAGWKCVQQIEVQQEAYNEYLLPKDVADFIARNPKQSKKGQRKTGRNNRRFRNNPEPQQVIVTPAPAPYFGRQQTQPQPQAYPSSYLGLAHGFFPPSGGKREKLMPPLRTHSGLAPEWVLLRHRHLHHQCLLKTS